jgi:anti-anti-sigma factor
MGSPSHGALTIDHDIDSDGSVRLRLEGELDAHGAPELETVLSQSVATGATVKVDLTEVSFVDSSGLAALLEARTRLAAVGGTLNIVGVSDAAARLLAIAGVDADLMDPDR